MAKLIKLITYAYLKEEVDIPQAIENDALEHKIYQAQETLRMLMGDEFYQDYLVQYMAGLSGAYLALYAYIKQYVAWQTYEFYIEKANLMSTRTGYRIFTEDNSTPPTDVQMATLIKSAKQKSQYYKILMVDYLNGHASDFPLYNVSCGTNNLTGNTFRISAVKNKSRHSHDCGCGCRTRTW